MTTNWQSLRGTVKTIGLRAGALWRWLTEPSKAVQKPEHRRRARLLAGMLATMIPGGIWIFFRQLPRILTISDLVTAFREEPRVPIVTVALVIFGVAYSLSRSKHYVWGAFILIATVFVADFAVVANLDTAAYVVGLLNYLLLCILLGSLFLPLWGTIILYIVCLLGIQMLPMFSVPSVVAYPESIGHAFNDVFIVGILIVVAAAMRQQDLGQIQQQARELVESTLDIARLEKARIEAENKRMRAELDITQRLQKMLLPTEAELHQLEGLDIAGFMEPADEVGGDYYDVLEHDGRVKIGIGDVTGHGLESGVVMLMLQTAVRALLVSGVSESSRFLNVLNQVLHDNMQRMQVDKSTSLTLLDCELGQMKLKASGQHEQMLIVRQGGQVEMMDTLDLGFPLGLEPEIARFVEETSIDLQPGDGIVLYSDGITEAENVMGEFYGLERLCEVVGSQWTGAAEVVKEAVVADVRRFIGEQIIYDDLTLLVVKQK